MAVFCHLSHPMASELFPSLSDAAILWFIPLFTRLESTQTPNTSEHPHRRELSQPARPAPGPPRRPTARAGRGHGGRGAASPTSRPSPRAFRAAVGAVPDPLLQGQRPRLPPFPGSSSGSTCGGPRASPGGGCAEPAGRRWVPGAGAALTPPRGQRGTGCAPGQG